MGIRPAQYEVAPDRLEAIQVTEDNMEDVAQWCGGEKLLADRWETEEHDGWLLNIPSLQGTLVANIGDYVTKNSQNRFWVYTKEQFEAKYHKVGVRPNIAINSDIPGNIGSGLTGSSMPGELPLEVTNPVASALRGDLHQRRVDQMRRRDG